MNLNDVLYRNPGLEGLNKIDAFINGIEQTLPEEISEEFCPVTSVEVETHIIIIKIFCVVKYFLRWQFWVGSVAPSHDM